jgi:beta-xylosidase
MSRLGTAVLSLLGVLAGLLVSAAPAQAYPGAPWFEPSKPYTSNFPDPEVLRVGDTYYAYGTSTGGAYLPVMTSRDLQTWTARPKYDPGAPLNRDPYFNDALPYPARWGGDFGGGRMTKQIWAPGVERFGDAYILFYAVRMPNSTRFCLSTARAYSPLGPFVDNSPGPLHCDRDPNGSIDPEPFRDPATGRAYLIWKSEGVPGSAPTKIWSRELGADGWTWAPGSSQREILRTSQGWEGNLIESPSMVRHNGQLYLFYSANEWASGAYATGYATCASVNGPCSKPRGTPLLASSGARLGPGAPSAFVDAQNRLRLAYHYWNAPFTSYPAYPACVSAKTCTTQGQRRMAITELVAGPGGLHVGTAAPAPAPAPASAPPPPAPPVLSTAPACPAGRVPTGLFADVAPADVHRPSVDCVAWWQVAAGVTSGEGGRQYLPKAGVTRGQMATFLARAIVRSGGQLPDGRDTFVDDRASVHQDAINRLAAAGVVAGVDKRHYAPDRLVTREQLATLLMRALRYRTGEAPRAAQDWFLDDAGSAHEASINAAASIGLASGTGAGSYAPTATVRRDQMASFLARLLTRYVADGARTP